MAIFRLTAQGQKQDKELSGVVQWCGEFVHSQNVKRLQKRLDGELKDLIEREVVAIPSVANSMKLFNSWIEPRHYVRSMSLIVVFHVFRSILYGK